MHQTDICILGAGPGGAGTALRMSYLGIPSLLLAKDFWLKMWISQEKKSN